MILPTTYWVALLLAILSMICWGSWANTFKLTGKWRFELFYFDYSFGLLLFAAIAAATLGQLGTELSFSDNIVIAGKRQLGYAVLAPPQEDKAAPKTPRIPGAAKPAPETNGGGFGGMVSETLFGRTGPRGGQYDGLVQTMAKTAARTVASGLGRQILRGVLGGLLGGKRSK
jgi:hypothetical protein